MAAVDPAVRVADLEAALGSGELTVESAGDRLTYRNIRELREAIDYFKARAIEAATPPGAAPAFGFSAPSYCRD